MKLCMFLFAFLSVIVFSIAENSLCLAQAYFGNVSFQETEGKTSPSIEV